MRGAHVDAPLTQDLGGLKGAPRVRRREKIGAHRQDVVHLAPADLRRTISAMGRHLADRLEVGAFTDSGTAAVDIERKDT